MCLKAVVSFVALLATVGGLRTFPPEFRFGAATAAYQVEGAWNVSDKGESIWDHIVHMRPDFIADRTNGDVACDSYHLWEEDLNLIESLGLDFYRFSIAWPRLLPHGFPNKVSQDGRRYYTQLIDGLRARGIEPVVTLYHWELPQTLQDMDGTWTNWHREGMHKRSLIDYVLDIDGTWTNWHREGMYKRSLIDYVLDIGGWTNPLTADWFADYARVVFSLFADRVRTWITINEPMSMCDVGYRGKLAPALQDHEISALLCSKNILLAHAKAYRIYDEEFKPEYGGEVSIANQEFWFEPDTVHDLDITLLARDYVFGRYTHPIYSAEGGWPPIVEKFLEEKSKREGYFRSRLPAFTADEIELLKGSYDFFALNHYTSRTVRAARPGEQVGSFLVEGVEEVGAIMGSRPHWGAATSGWLKVNPEGLRNNLRQIKQQYGDVRVLITENGFSDGGGLDDVGRVRYYKEYLGQVFLAMTEDAVNVVGYTAWSLMDNFEWGAGYLSRFGLVSVDFTDPRRPRTLKASARYYRSVAQTHSLDA